MKKEGGKRNGIIMEEKKNKVRTRQGKKEAEGNETLNSPRIRGTRTWIEECVFKCMEGG